MLNIVLVLILQVWNTLINVGNELKLLKMSTKKHNK